MHVFRFTHIATTINYCNFNFTNPSTNNCNGMEHSGKDSIINAQNTKNVTINGNGEKSCSSMIVNCGRGGCNINCTNTCNGLALTCGMVGQSVIDCSGPINSYKCSQSALPNINTNFAQQFQCAGAPISHTNLIKSRTNKPTISPSINPTNTLTASNNNFNTITRPSHSDAPTATYDGTNCKLWYFGTVATFLIALFGSVLGVILLRVYVSETGIVHMKHILYQ